MQVSEQGRSQDLFYAATYQVACGITSAHSLISPRRLLAGSVFISFHFWKVPLKKILTLFKIIFGIRTCVFGIHTCRAPSSPNRFYAYGSFKKGSYEQRAFNGFLYYIHMPNFGLKFCPNIYIGSSNPRWNSCHLRPPIRNPRWVFSPLPIPGPKLQVGPCSAKKPYVDELGRMMRAPSRCGVP